MPPKHSDTSASYPWSRLVTPLTSPSLYHIFTDYFSLF